MKLATFDYNLLNFILFALRFTTDDELKELIERTLFQNLSGIKIKKAIQHWKGDYSSV